MDSFLQMKNAFANPIITNLQIFAYKFVEMDTCSCFHVMTEIQLMKMAAQVLANFNRAILASPRMLFPPLDVSSNIE
jgi:hypothetical protein